jgi:hypothetical protein
MKKICITLLALVISASTFSQFNNTDTLRRFVNRWITNSAINAFTDYRLNTALNGMINFIDSARAGLGGSAVDTIWRLTDSTIRYRKNGQLRTFSFKGIYDSRRKVDSMYYFNDTTIRYVMNGTARSLLLKNWAISNASGSGDTLYTAATIKRLINGFGLDFTVAAGSITIKADTSELATPYDILTSVSSGTHWELDGSNNLTPKTFAGKAIRADNKSLLFFGNTGYLPNSGGGIQLWWWPGKRAFRAGFVTGTQWDSANVGTYSWSGGFDSRASGDNSFAFGGGSIASASGSVAFAAGNASGSGSIAMGGGSKAQGSSTIAIGNFVDATGPYSSAFGSFTQSMGFYSTTFGNQTIANQNVQFAVGKFNDTVSAANLFMVGYGSGIMGPNLRRNVFSVDTSGHLKGGTPSNGSPADSGVVWDNVDSMYKKVASGVLNVVVSSAGTLNITTAEVYTFTGTTTTWTLPAVSGNTGRSYRIKNRGSSDITLNSNAGGSDIYNTAATNTVTVAAGADIVVVNDGTYYLIFD